ncbi:MAG: metallophosphoesterase [Desulforhopalus sp.]
MTTLAHISDLHFGREDPRLIDGMMHSLEKIQPQLVVISGDLTQRARQREFKAARAFLDSLPWPHLVIAGNHDIPAYNFAERFFTPWKKWRRYLGYPLEPIVSGSGYIAIGINTARRSGTLIDWSRGRVSPEQISVMAGHLDKCEDEKLRVIVAHHPFWLPEDYRHRHTIGGRDMALSAMRKTGVDIILSGHVHFAYTRLLDGLIISHAGTAVSNRLNVNNRNSFKIVRGNRRKLAIETWEWGNTSFSIAKERFFNRTRGEWMDDA